MTREYNFDDTCDFTDISKEELVYDINKWNTEKTILNMGEYKYMIHPCRILTCNETLSDTYENVIHQLVREFFDNDDETEAVKNIFRFYDEEFNEKRLSDLIDYMICTICSYYQNLKDGMALDPAPFRQILELDK